MEKSTQSKQNMKHILYVYRVLFYMANQPHKPEKEETGKGDLYIVSVSGRQFAVIYINFFLKFVSLLWQNQKSNPCFF